MITVILTATVLTSMDPDLPVRGVAIQTDGPENFMYCDGRKATVDLSKFKDIGEKCQ